MCSGTAIPFSLPGFEIDQVEEYQRTFSVHAHSTAQEAACPSCDHLSSHVHSYYSRSPRDLPSSEYRLRLVLTVRRFHCRNPSCEQRTFAERIPQVVPVHGQRTVRLTDTLRAIAFETSAESGARITHRLKMPVSGDTLLRIMRQTTLPVGTAPRVLGVDDWAVKKGQRYGTLLVDLESQQPIDLLPDRTAETLASWLQAYPQVEIITRDRSNEYIAGITEGAPQAIQIADRWHLLCNQTEALQRLVETHSQDLKSVAQQVQQRLYPTQSDDAGLGLEPPPDAPIPPSQKELRYHEVKALAAQGHSQRAIAHQLRMSRKTVRRYLNCQEPPTRQQRRRAASIIAPYLPHLDTRWKEGCHNARILWEEIRTLGFPGSYSTVRWFLRPYRHNPLPLDRPVVRPLSPRQATWLLLENTDDLTLEQHLYRDLLLQHCPDLALAYPLAQQFLDIVRQQQVDLLDPWLASAQASSIPQLKTFADGLLRDYAAVKAALTYEWSNGQVEGQVNRLKVIKRVMYGRARFDLLRLRVLFPT